MRKTHLTFILFSACQKCKTSNYCGRECQVAHWTKHKELCKSLSRDKMIAERQAAERAEKEKEKARKKSMKK